MSIPRYIVDGGVGQMQMVEQVGIRRDAMTVLFVRNLPLDISIEEMDALFGKYGSIKYIWIGQTFQSRGTAFVDYETSYDAEQAYRHLAVGHRQMVVEYFQPHQPPFGISLPSSYATSGTLTFSDENPNEQPC